MGINNRNALKVAIVDNDRFTLDMLAAALPRFNTSLSVIWKTPQGRQAVEWALDPASRPDVLLVDMSLEDTSGAGVCSEIRSHTSSVILIAVTAFSLERYARRAAEAGAQGIVQKAQLQALADAVVEAALQGTLSPWRDVKFEDRVTAHERLVSSSNRTLRFLSAMEQQVLAMSAQGSSTAEIADKLGVKTGTVKTHMQRVKQKLGAATLQEANALWWKRER